LVKETGGPGEDHRPAHPIGLWGRHGRDHMVVEFTTTCAISAYHH